jgi:2-phospho-L-lactate guanylyltransferase
VSRPLARRPLASRAAVLVPVKPLSEAKSRLAPALAIEDRQALVRAMLADLLAAVRAAHAGPLLVISPDDAYDGLIARAGARRLADEGRGYRAAVERGLASTEVRRAGAALVIPADQPRAQPHDVARALAALDEAEVVLVAAADEGTGALGLSPPDAIAPAFGERSAAAHRRLAYEGGRRLVELDCPSLAHDVDRLEELLDPLPPPPGPATARLLERLLASTGAGVAGD